MKTANLFSTIIFTNIDHDSNGMSLVRLVLFTTNNNNICELDALFILELIEHIAYIIYNIK